MKRALQKIVDLIAGMYPEGMQLRLQLLHGKNPESLEILRELLTERFQNILWTPTATVGPILGAHTGAGLVGLGVGPADLFKEMPGIVMNA